MVSTTNAPALRFYRQYGFVRTRLVKRYYGAGRDAWRMCLNDNSHGQNNKAQTGTAKYRPENASTRPPSAVRLL